MRRVEIFSTDQNRHSEGPLWDVEEQCLHWIDSYGPAIHSCDFNGSDRKTWALDQSINR